MRYDFPGVSIVRLLDVWFRGIANFDVAHSFALGKGLLAKTSFMSPTCIPFNIFNRCRTNAGVCRCFITASDLI